MPLEERTWTNLTHQVTRDDIVRARDRIFDDFKPFLRRTPLLKVAGESIGVP